MNKSRRSPHMFIFAITMLVGLPSASPAQVRVLISGGFSAPYQELLPQFEKSTGFTVTTARGASEGDGRDGPTSIGAELRSGQPADVVILSREGLAGLSAEGRILIGSDVDLASVPLGVGVRAGKPRPDISTVNGFKQTLLQAKSIGIQSTSATYLKTKVFPQLGIADALADKLSGAGAAEVASGGVEMVVPPVSEILPVRGVDFVGTIPADLQFVQVFTAAVVKGSKNPEASKRLIEFLASEMATPTVEKWGMKRPRLPLSLFAFHAGHIRCRPKEQEIPRRNHRPSHSDSALRADDPLSPDLIEPERLALDSESTPKRCFPRPLHSSPPS
jgi:molybdate transport system substrate-binding protein